MVKYYRCKACGKYLEDKKEHCPDCGSSDFKLFITRIAFEYPGIRFPFSIHKPMKIGRNHFRLYGDNYSLLDNEQFECFIQDGRWMIRGFPSRNPTFLNGNDITHKSFAINDGDVIKIAGFELKVKFVEEEVLP